MIIYYLTVILSATSPRRLRGSREIETGISSTASAQSG